MNNVPHITHMNPCDWDLAYRVGLKTRLYQLKNNAKIGKTGIEELEKTVHHLNYKYKQIELKLRKLEGLANTREANTGLKLASKKRAPVEDKKSVKRTVAKKATNLKFKKEKN